MVFNLFKKKKAEDVFRKKVSDAFEESVRIAEKKLTGNPMFDGMIVQTAIGSTRKFLIESPELQVLGMMADWIPEQIIDEECKRVMQKYLE